MVVSSFIFLDFVWNRYGKSYEIFDDHISVNFRVLQNYKNGQNRFTPP